MCTPATSQGISRKVLFLGNSYTYYCSTDFADFDQMQDSLTVSYKAIADSLQSPIAPVGEAWRLVLNTTSMVLHSDDESHPNLNGSYLAACVFYSSIFGKPSTGLSFTAGLLPDSALILQQAADSIVFGYAYMWNFTQMYPVADYSYTLSGDTMYTHNLSSGADQWKWDFGDGYTSNEFEPMHQFPSYSTYLVSLVAGNDCHSDSVAQQVSVLPSSVGLIPDAGCRIRLSGPDALGTMSIQGYDGKGTLILYDGSGRMIETTTVSSGSVTLNHLPRQLCLYLLVNPSGEILAKGKLPLSAR